jgi:pimeloyl-ACP methyl ester carboxylesterase
MWPTKNTAFMVIHGSGPHRPFETVGSFAVGFWGLLQKEEGLNIQWTHKLRRRDGWIESYISLTSEGKPSVDFYEYYWDCYMVRDVTIGEAMEWLDEASAGARRFYKEDMPARAECYKNLGIDLFKDGEFEPGGYKNILGVSEWLLRLRLLLRPFWGWRSKTLDTLIGDVVIYTKSDVRSGNYDIRQKMLSGAIDELGTLLKNDYYGQVVVVGHSLGSIIAYDAVNRIALDMSTDGGLSPALAPKFAGLVTLGAPLDKTAFFFQYRLLSAEDQARWRKKGSPPGNGQTAQESTSSTKTKPPKNFVQNEITLHLHSFKRLALSIDEKAIDISDPIEPYLDKAIWLNFHHQKDRISGHLDAYRDVRNIECQEVCKDLNEAHAFYWIWEKMYADIASQFFQ